MKRYLIEGCCDGGNDEDWHELERLEGLAYAAIAKATGTATAA